MEYSLRCNYFTSSQRVKQKFILLGKSAIIVFRVFIIYTSLIALSFTMPLDGKAEILFQSSFEGNVSLHTPRIINGDWWQDISYDASAGFLPGGTVERVMFKIEGDVVKTVSDLNTYIKSEIQTVKDARGKSTRAWLLHNIKHFHSGPPYYTGQRISLNVDSGYRPPNDLEELYIKYDMKFIPQFESSMTGGSWYLIWENTVKGNTNKIHVSRVNNNSPLIWRLQTHKDISYYNNSIPVPLNKWFEVSIYFKHSISNNGKIKVSINGANLFDYTGSTAESGGVYATNILKSYSNKANVGHWVDNIVIADSYNGQPKQKVETPIELKITGSSQ
jgi:hypothetical protein